jgi:hypothetical protein
VNAADLPRRRFLHLAASAAAFPTVSRDASAQAYPSRPITMIVPFAAKVEPRSAWQGPAPNPHLEILFDESMDI